MPLNGRIPERTQHGACPPEYFTNTKERDEVRIFKSTDGGIHWNPVYTFEKGAIRHIHSVQFDSYKNLLWTATGDKKREAKVAYSKDGG